MSPVGMFWYLARNYATRIACFLVLAVAGAVAGTFGEARHLAWLDALGLVVCGGSLGCALAAVVRAVTAVAGIRLGERLAVMKESAAGRTRAAAAAGPARGQFAAGLRVVPPPVTPVGPLTAEPGFRWLRGRVVMTPDSVTWKRSLTGRVRDLTAARCGQDRCRDAWTEVNLLLPACYEGEVVRVLALHDGGTDLELAAPAVLLGLLRDRLAVNGAATQVRSEKPRR